jgi:hypothetical protein
MTAKSAKPFAQHTYRDHFRKPCLPRPFNRLSPVMHNINALNSIIAALGAMIIPTYTMILPTEGLIAAVDDLCTRIGGRMAHVPA